MKTEKATKASPTKIVKPEKTAEINKDNKLYINLKKKHNQAIASRNQLNSQISQQKNQFNPSKQKVQTSNMQNSIETTLKTVNASGVAAIMAGDYIVKNKDPLHSSRNFGRPSPLLDLYFTE